MKLLLLLCTVLLTAAIGTTQITHRPNTGCRIAPQIPIGKQPRLGTTLTVASTQLPCQTFQALGFILLSAGCNTAPPLHLGCFNNPCVLLLPDVILSRPVYYILYLAIPNDPTLVGTTFCVQGGCLSRVGAACMFPLSQVAEIKIQP